MRRADGHISATGWVFVVVCFILATVLATLIGIVLLVVNTKDQSEQNQQHIDCIIALAQATIPESCEAVKDQLIADGIITQAQLDASRVTTTAP